MKSDRDFLTFLKGMLRGKRLLFFLGVLALVAVLIIIGRSDDTEEETDSNDTEAQIAELCSQIDGVGECKVTVVFEEEKYKDGQPKVYSVAIVCEGGDNIRVRARLTELITSLYGIGANRVSVMRLGK